MANRFKRVIQSTMRLDEPTMNDQWLYDRGSLFFQMLWQSRQRSTATVPATSATLEQAALPGIAAAGLSSRRQRARRRTGQGPDFRHRAYAPIGEFDVDPHSRIDGGGQAQRSTGVAANEREAARQHAVIGQRGEKLGCMLELGIPPVEQRIDGERRSRRQPIHPLAGAGNTQAMRLCVGAQACGEPYRGGSEALAATLAVYACTMSGPRRERQRPLTVACDA